MVAGHWVGQNGRGSIAELEIYDGRDVVTVLLHSSGPINRRIGDATFA